MTIMGRGERCAGRDPLTGLPLQFLILLFIIPLLLSFCNTSKKRNLAKVHRDLGINLINQGKPEEAIKELLTALDLNRKDADTFHFLALAYFQKGIFDKAERYFLHALKLKPDYPECSLNLGALYISMGRWDDAIRINESLTRHEMYRSPARVYNNLGLAYFNKKEYEKAEISYKKALEIAPYFCLAHYNMGNLYREMNEIQKAIESFRKAVKYCPEDAKSNLNLGLLLLEKGEIEEGIRILEHVKKIDSDGIFGREAENNLKLFKKNEGR